MLCFLLVSYVCLYACNYFFNKLCILSEIPPYYWRILWQRGTTYMKYGLRWILQTLSTRLPADLGYTNLTDQHVSLVWIPEFTYFPTYLHNVTTDVERNLKLRDISGLPVGHVPRGLSLAFLQLIENNCQIHALTIGDVMEKGGGISYSLWLFNHMFTRHHQLCQRGNFQCNRTNAWEEFHGIGGYIKVWTTVCIVNFFFLNLISIYSN